MKIILCHKCGGKLTGVKRSDLYDCSCMSGYVREWQKPISLAEAKVKQAEMMERRLALYHRQGRSDYEISELMRRNCA